VPVMLPCAKARCYRRCHRRCYCYQALALRESEVVLSLSLVRAAVE